MFAGKCQKCPKLVLVNQLNAHARPLLSSRKHMVFYYLTLATGVGGRCYHLHCVVNRWKELKLTTASHQSCSSVRGTV